ncbi:hypothetical protein Lal_00023899 [Lupinus albus]|nr:hypothetical protein Lal_00023899 [Lupinus albus]
MGVFFKVPLPNNKVVALKKLHGFMAEDPNSDESFRSEVDLSSKIKHRHIVKLLVSWTFSTYKLFYPSSHIQCGTSHSNKSNDIEAIELEWRKRVNIIKGIAHARSYLHHDCITPILALQDSSNVTLPIEL